MVIPTEKAVICKSFVCYVHILFVIITLWLMKLGITMLIHYKDDIEFVTEFPWFLGHPVVCKTGNFSSLQYVRLFYIKLYFDFQVFKKKMKQIFNLISCLYLNPKTIYAIKKKFLKQCINKQYTTNIAIV